MLSVTHLEVDLPAIAHNVEQAKALHPHAKVLVPIKANAYGHGAVPVARYLEEQDLADWFGVARTSEGQELREAGIKRPILKLSPCIDEDEWDAAIAAQITLAVGDERTIAAASAAAQRAGRTDYPVHLAVDTGMGRIGCRPNEAEELAGLIGADPAIKLDGLFTHFAISDSPSGDQFTASQIAAIRSVSEDIGAARGSAGLDPIRLVHASNSGGVLCHPGGFEMIRPGIMTYGYYPDESIEKRVDLRPAATWKSRVSYCKKVLAGDTVSYGRTWTAPVDSWIATVPVGYADGFSRLNSNRGRMLVGGVTYPIAGRVCMDQTMLDLGPAVEGQDVPVAVGDEVIIMGRQADQCITPQEIADIMGTISYEVTCLISARVPRRYLT